MKILTDNGMRDMRRQLSEITPITANNDRLIAEFAAILEHKHNRNEPATLTLPPHVTHSGGPETIELWPHDFTAFDWNDNP